jgi:FAD/FMN-containing dehydrogenase
MTVVAPHLDAAIDALDAGDSSTYSAAWIDCLAQGKRLGRSLIYLGEHARIDELSGHAANSLFPVTRAPRLAAPFDFPGFCLNRWSVSAFNELYFRWGARNVGAPFLVPFASFFFPLDGVGDWNRIYGRSGLVQYQSVVPLESARTVLPEMLGRIAKRGDASFLAVLKKLGPTDGVLSFPFPGYTLALDFPMRPGLLPFLDELDEVIVRAGGRLYLAKDARQSRAVFEAGYPGLARFRATKRSIDPRNRLRSHLSDRLGI